MRTSVVPSLAWARLRYRPLRRVLVVLGVAAATALPVAAQASAQVVASQAVQYGVQALAPGDRSVIVSFSGIELSGSDLAAADTRSRSALSSLTTGRARAELLYRRAADLSGGTFFLGAADDLGTAVRVTQGRLPSSCTPRRCEVVVVGGGSPALDPALGLVVVGRAVRTDPLLLTGTFDPGHDAPLLLADGVAATQALASLQQFQRSYGWVAPLDFGIVQRLGVPAYLDRSAATSDALAAFRSGLVITSPDATLSAEDARARLSARRFTLLGASATVLLLGFCVIAATGLRRDRLALDALLRRRGATRWTVRLLATVEAVVPVLVGTLLGLGLGALVGAVTATQAGLAAGSTAATAVTAALPGVLLGAALAVVVVAVTSSWGGSADRTAWRVVDATVVVGLAVVALSVARGTVGAAALDSGTDPLLAALPVLVVLCGGLLAARLWPATVTLLGRVVPHRWVAARLALLGGSRRPLRPVATVAFLTAATAVVVFAGSYRSTLAQGAVDQAAFTVPLSARVSTGSTLERPLDVAPPSAYAALAAGARVRPVVRSAAGLRVSATEAVPVEVLGVDPAADRTTGRTRAPAASAAYADGGATSSGRSRVEPVDTRAESGTVNAAWSTAPCASVERYEPANT
ncbi:MAG: FtsX-like permease family protein, partial [Actinomycetes bacterium]